jgi:hypothetical protein
VKASGDDSSAMWSTIVVQGPGPFVVGALLDRLPNPRQLNSRHRLLEPVRYSGCPSHWSAMGSQEAECDFVVFPSLGLLALLLIRSSGIDSLNVVKPFHRVLFHEPSEFVCRVRAHGVCCCNQWVLAPLVEDLLEPPLSPSMVLICRFVQVNAGHVKGSFSLS